MTVFPGGEKAMKFPIKSILAAAAALVFAAPAAAQLVPGEKEAAIAAIPGVIAAGAKWDRAWSGPMTADGMTAAADGTLLFAQEQSNSIRRLWLDGREWVLYPYITGAGAVSVDSAGRIFAVERACSDPGLGQATCAVPSRVVQLAPERKVLADKFADGKPLGRLNDVLADGHGGVYWTQGGLYHVSADGTVGIIADKVEKFTNGLALSPDGKMLYVTDDKKIWAFNVGADGGTNRRVFATLSETGGFGGDGLAVDNDGRLYVTADAGIYVFDKAGKALGVIPVPRRAITLAFAGADRHTLYVGAMGAETPDGRDWTTPQGVRNVAMTIYKVQMLSAGPANRPK
ncbi:MAG: SMP-30/gluconolactonase/LRE family protein [Candidatus Andeanibacterium colombiense]|uniref:SMP-30/gluconolactonase/LRE family protein n=1 Tax=Candidatus Andeanibacterium colombiense TaxID=3121345 RepID=A0AAJ6BPW8_9SPHN|nr:MAG: SMP-30/gluconolactonase/LRE family protein [Sphingomonadaceae bacterium]